MQSNTAAGLLRAFTFHPDEWMTTGYSPCRTTVPVSTRHSKAESSECLSACMGRNTPGTDLDSHSVRKPSSGTVVECRWSQHLGRDRHSISVFLRRINPRAAPQPAERRSPAYPNLDLVLHSVCILGDSALPGTLRCAIRTAAAMRKGTRSALRCSG